MGFITRKFKAELMDDNLKTFTVEGEVQTPDNVPMYLGDSVARNYVRAQQEAKHRKATVTKVEIDGKDSPWR
ncbi:MULTISPECIES: hypothetical protein [unclassified Streptomyces]|uniref:hypothetical protein n=1 Tax=unclassified Streptomyces TaxID=2593676 RepID=UPI0036FED6BE